MSNVSLEIKGTKTPLPNGDIGYKLYVTSDFGSLHFNADGHGPIPFSINSKGENIIELYVTEGFPGLHRVIHEIDLGSITWGLQNPKLHVVLKSGNGIEAQESIHIEDVDDEARPGQMEA